MNDNFGSLSSDSLPPGYGEADSKVIQCVSEPDPHAGDPATLESMDDYDGIKDWKIFGGEGRSSSDNSGSAASSWDIFGSKADADTKNTSSAGTAPEAPPASRECKNVRGYTYRQYASGKIEILDGPGGKGKGTTVGSSHQAAVAAEIAAVCGPYPTSGGESAPASVLDRLLASAGLDPVGATVAASTGSSRGAAVGAGVGAAAAQLLPSLMAILGPQTVTAYDEESDDVGNTGGGTGAPWGLIIGGVAILGTLGFVAYAVTRDDDEE